MFSEETEEASLEVRTKKKATFTMKHRWTMLDTTGLPQDKQSGVMWEHFEEKDQYGETPWILTKEYLIQQREKILRNSTDVQVNWEGVYSFYYYDHSKFRSQERHYTSRRKLRAGSTLASDMGRLLSASDGCPGDMSVMSSDGFSLSVHRDVLCARSPVFAAMMKRDMVERQSGVVRISDIVGTTLEQLVSFLYTGHLENEHQMDCDTLVGLYAAGEKYEVLSLKKRCSSLLSDCVSADNACDLIKFSELYSDPELQERVYEVILKRRAGLRICWPLS